MRERRALRFVVEALFLGALAAGLVVADLQPVEIAGIMLVGWVVVALYEWAVTREGPHYGRGLPPRYYVPQVSLPPPRPLEQLPNGYPSTAFQDEEPTWIATPGMLADWPVAPGTAPGSPGEETVVDEVLFTAIAQELREEQRREPEPVADEVVEPEPEAEPVAVAVARHEVEPEPEVIEDHGAVEATADATEEKAVSVLREEPVVPALETSLYRFDPLGQPASRRRRRRPSASDDGIVEVPARPPTPAGLPGDARRGE